jgi:8-oxo-dGTP pyrophosphatase MutT (NUDIX family)
MHRDPLLRLLAAYAVRFPAERAVVERFTAFVAAHPDCFERTCVPGHVTGSAWVVSHDHARFLLTHHRKLGRWLQVGGHSDGDPDTAAVALREATEESGMAGLALASIGGRASASIGGCASASIGGLASEAFEPLDLDAHEIPARGDEPAHVHYDVRFLVVAPPGATIAISEESLDLRWFPADAPLGVASDESVARLMRKARAARG